MKLRILGAGIAACALLLPATLAQAAPEHDDSAGQLRSTDAQRWRPLAATPLPPGDAGVKRIAVTRNGKRAVLLQSYGATSRMIQLNLTKSPARIMGKNASVRSNVDSDLEVHQPYAYATNDDVLQVVSLKRKKPRIIRRVTIGNNEFWDLALTPNGKFLYATAFNITWPANKLIVFRVKKNGVPKRVRTIKRFALGRIEVTTNGKRLIAIDEINDRVVTYSLKRPGRPKRAGKVFPTGISDADNIAVAKRSRFAYLSGGTTAEVAKIDLRKRRTVKTRLLSTDFGGDIAVTNGGQVVTTLSNAYVDDPSVVVMNGKLKSVATFEGLCFPDGVAASWAGPTKGRVYLGDSGICQRAGFYPMRR